VILLENVGPNGRLGKVNAIFSKHCTYIRRRELMVMTVILESGLKGKQVIASEREKERLARKELQFCVPKPKRITCLIATGKCCV